MGDQSDRMRAVVAPRPGGPEALEIQLRPRPVPAEGEVLVRVEAAGVNRPDVHQRQGHYPPPQGVTDVLGLEIAGEVVALGPNARAHRLGAQVTALVPGGGYADYCVAHETNALPIPSGLTTTEAAAIPETYFTVWTNVFARGALKAGETLLVHGGDLWHRHDGDRARQGVRGARRRHRRIGRESRVDASGWAPISASITARTISSRVTLRATGGRGADVILDMVGGDYVARNYAAAALDGRIVQIAFLKDQKAVVDLRLIMTKRLTHTGSTLRPRSPAEKAVIAEALRAKVWPLLEAGRCRPVIDSVFPLSEVVKAHERIESADHIGKVVLTM